MNRTGKNQYSKGGKAKAPKMRPERAKEGLTHSESKERKVAKRAAPGTGTFTKGTKSANSSNAGVSLNAHKQGAKPSKSGKR